MSTLKADTIQNTSGGPVTLTDQFAVKSRIRTSYSTFSIDESYNISSITDISTGTGDISLTSSMNTSTYSVCGQCAIAGFVGEQFGVSATTSGYRNVAASHSGAVTDYTKINSMTFGDLA